MKKVILLLLVCCFIFSGCSEESKERVDAFFNSPVYNNYSGMYVMQGNEFEEGDEIPTLKLDMSNLKFVFNFNISSSYSLEGKIERQGGMLVLTTSDEKYTYVFKILDRYTLQFRKEYSSTIKVENDNFGIDIKDKTIFALSEEERTKIQKEREKMEEEEDNFIYWAY